MNAEAFRAELEGLINRHSMENGSSTPDFILAKYLAKCLTTFDETVLARETWYGRQLSGEPFPSGHQSPPVAVETEKVHDGLLDPEEVMEEVHRLQTLFADHRGTREQAWIAVAIDRIHGIRRAKRTLSASVVACVRALSEVRS
jgi:hypothetical protein